MALLGKRVPRPPKVWRLGGKHVVKEALGAPRQVNGYDLAILQALVGKHVYAGTAARREVGRRPDRCAVAARQRRIRRSAA